MLATSAQQRADRRASRHGTPLRESCTPRRLLVDYFTYGEGIFVGFALLVSVVAVLALFSGPR
jgi:hypothetical protein